MIRCPPTSRRCRLLTAALLGLGCAIGGGQAVEAQEPAGRSFLQRGLQGIIGGGERAPGAYVSPSAIPDGTAPESFGLSAPSALRKLDPIPLPGQMDNPSAPLIDLPGLPAYAPQRLPSLDIIRTRKTLVFDAKLTAEGDTIPTGLVWRLFSPIADGEGRLPLIASARGGTATFEVSRGSYLLHVGFGRAGVTKRVDFSGEQTREVVVLEAGGLRLDAVAAGDVPIAPESLTFDIFSDAAEERDRQLIADDVAPKTLVELNAGTYHVVSNFGSVNAVVRADVTVEAGKVTDVTLQHRAAQLTMKLVREKGGEAIADTAWTISSTSGDLVRESVGAFPSMVLAEGDYTVVAKNKDRLYQRDFEVEAGVNTDVEVLTTDLLTAPSSSEGSGD